MFIKSITPASPEGMESSGATEVSNETLNPQSETPESAPQTPQFDVMNHKVKAIINGREQEVTVARALAEAQKSMAAHEKFTEGKRAREEAETLRKTMKSDLVSVLKAEGLSPQEIKTLLTQSLNPFIEDELMSEDERELRDLRKLKTDKDEEENRRKKTDEEKAESAALQKEIDTLDSDLAGAMGRVGLPANPLLAKWAAQKMLGATRNGYHLDAVSAAQIVKEEFTESLQSVLSGMDDAVLETFVGKDRVGRLMDSRVSKFKEAEAPFVKTRKASTEQDSVPLIHRTDKSDEVSPRHVNPFKELRRNLK